MQFLSCLLAAIPATLPACLTLSALHPDGQHPTPSRHIALSDADGLSDALSRLQAANAAGWGAVVGIGLRRMGLTRWQRGGEVDVMALPALFVDVDDPSAAARARLIEMQPAPSCLLHSGGGYHAYWWLTEPLTDMTRALVLLKALAARTGGDSLSPAQSLRLVGSVNTKPARGGAMCRLLHLSDTRYDVSAFASLIPCQTTPRRTNPHFPSTKRLSDMLNPALIDAVTRTLIQSGCRQRGDWLNGPCLTPHRHKNGDAHPSFGFNTRTGYGYCYRCGAFLLKDVCSLLGVVPTEYGGLFAVQPKRIVS